MVTLFTSHTEAVNNAGEAASEIILLIILVLLPIVPCLAAGLPLHQTPHLLAKTDHHHQRREIRHLVFLTSCWLHREKGFRRCCVRCASPRHTIGDRLPSCMSNSKGHSRSFFFIRTTPATLFLIRGLNLMFAAFSGLVNCLSPTNLNLCLQKLSETFAPNATAQEGAKGKISCYVWSKAAKLPTVDKLCGNKQAAGLDTRPGKQTNKNLKYLRPE